jgi:hypothetical protein
MVLASPAQRVNHLGIGELVGDATPTLRHLLRDVEDKVEEPLVAKALHEVGEGGVLEALVLVVKPLHAWPELVVDEVHGRMDVAAAEEGLDEVGLCEGAGSEPPVLHFVEQLLGGTRVGGAGVPVEERSV